MTEGNADLFVYRWAITYTIWPDSSLGLLWDSRVWQLTLVTVAVVPLMALAGGTYAAVTVGLTGKSQKAYAEAGGVALEVNTFSLLHMLISYPDAISKFFLRKLNPSCVLIIP